MAERICMALGGNAILQRGQKGTHEEQMKSVYETCKHLLKMIKKGYDLVITHGNGPQVGAILLQNEIAKDTIPPKPLDCCGSMTQGQIGYMIQQSFGNLFKEEGMDKKVVTVLTQVLLDRSDPKFQNPTKPVGSFYNEAEAKDFQAKLGWTVKEDSGRGWRRVVPSPVPSAIIEKEAINTLIKAGYIVIASGGGGIPVLKREDGNGLEGCIAVIDKDLAGERLARDTGADIFLILTDVDAVRLNYGKPDEKKLSSMTVKEAEQYYEEGHFAAGSMGPKVLAATKFVKEGGKRSIIASLEHAIDALDGKSGTTITQ